MRSNKIEARPRSLTLPRNATLTRRSPDPSKPSETGSSRIMVKLRARHTYSPQAYRCMGLQEQDSAKGHEDQECKRLTFGLAKLVQARTDTSARITKREAGRKSGQEASPPHKLCIGEGERSHPQRGEMFEDRIDPITANPSRDQSAAKVVHSNPHGRAPSPVRGQTTARKRRPQSSGWCLLSKPSGGPRGEQCRHSIRSSR